MMRKIVALILPVATCALVGIAGSQMHAAADPPSMPTFTKDVAPILMRSCVQCHRPGQVAPMSLLTYEDARPWARSIRNRVTDARLSAGRHAWCTCGILLSCV